MRASSQQHSTLAQTSVVKKILGGLMKQQNLAASLYNPPSYIIYNLRNLRRNLCPSVCICFIPYTDRLFVRPATGPKSFTPRIHEWRTPGRSRAPPPQTKIAECLRNVCPIPGIWATTFLIFTKIILATGRLAELGFLGVAILIRITVPRTWGFPCNTPL